MRTDWKKIGIKQLAALISEKLRERGIDAILVGGACVSIYTKNRYLSFDLDFVTHATLKKVATALADIGFKRESSRHFIRSGCPFFIEFVAPPAAIGNEPVRDKVRLKTKMGTVVMLTPTDSVKDRLAAYYHWNDPQALEQALMVAKAQKINLRDVKRWSEKEGHTEKYREFLNRLRAKS
ncbi:MAG: hypothetical protein A2Y97_09640 [Nitrospirae bacterium RBG_13_39_12]|nr:MAG: hypothetical protein A2Y97_09640 [Nitrospirae bacterium RBG_13_39_12]